LAIRASCRPGKRLSRAGNGVFADPHGRYVGYAALNDAVSQLHTRFPGFVFTPIGAPQALYDVGR